MVMLNGNRIRLAAMLEVQKGFCFWCRGSIALAPRRGDDRNIVRRTHIEMDVFWGGKLTTYGVATVDHVVPRCKNGRSAESNFVAACAACNRDRGSMHHPTALDPTGLDRWIATRPQLASFRQREVELRQGR